VLSTIPATDLCGVNIIINITDLVQVGNIFYVFDSKLIYRERNFLNKVFRVIGFSEGNSAKMRFFESEIFKAIYPKAILFEKYI